MAYKIGTTLENMVTLKSLGIKNPSDDPAIASDAIITGGRMVRSVGSPVNNWHWGIISLSARNALKNYCTGKSAWVYIETMEADRNYSIYYALMVWPDRERQTVDKVLDLTIDFMFMTKEEETS